jgi:hypothetical protein
MDSKQLARLEQLNSQEFFTPWEDEEHRELLRLESDERRVYEALREQGIIEA